MTPGGESADQMHTSEAIAKRIKTNIENYGDSCGQLHTPEAREKAKRTTALKYSGDPYGQIHTKESIQNKILSDKANHGGMLSIHTKEARHNASLVRVRNNNLYRLNQLRSQGLDLEFWNFLYMICDDHPWRQIATLLRYLPEILWFELEPDEYEMYKIIYEYCSVNEPEWTSKYLDYNPFEQFE